MTVNHLVDDYALSNWKYLRQFPNWNPLFLLLHHCAKNHISQVLEYHRKLKKTKAISHHQKVQNKNFSITSKYHLSINFLTQKKTVISITEKFKTKTSQWSVNIIFPSTFWLKKRRYFPVRRYLSVKMIFHSKENITCRAESLSSSFLRLPKLCRNYGKIISLPAYNVEKDFFCSQKSITSTFPLS